MAWPASIPTFGGLATAAQFNALRDALKAIGDPWTAYGPSLTSNGTNPTVGASTITGSYRLTGKTADVHMNVTIGTGFAPGTGIYRLSLPSGVAPLSTSSAEAMGYATVLDTSASATFTFTVLYVSGTTISMLGASGSVSSTSPMTWAAGDRISVHIPALQIT